MTTTTRRIPTIRTADLLGMGTGEVMDLGEGGTITCLDQWNKSFRYQDVHEFERIDFAYDDKHTRFLAASWSNHNSEWTCGDLTTESSRQGWLYAYSRTLQGLSGMRTYKTAGALIRRRLEW